MAKKVKVEFVEITVRFVDQGPEFFDYAVKANRDWHAIPGKAEFHVTKSGTSQNVVGFLQHLLDKIRDAYNSENSEGNITICVEGPKILADSKCAPKKKKKA